MMEWGYGNMMNGGFWVFGSLLWIVVFADLILVGVWLFRQIQKKGLK